MDAANTTQNPTPHTSSPTSDLSAGDDTVLCPRCGTPLFEGSEPARFYGPCGTCRKHLRDVLWGEGSDASVAEYEPKMNVTPNAVALKDD